MICCYYANLSSSEQFRFVVDGHVEQVAGTMRMRADSGDMLRAAAEAGLGVVVLPNFIASPAIGSASSKCCCATIRCRRPACTPSCRPVVLPRPECARWWTSSRGRFGPRAGLGSVLGSRGPR
jgi:DNA-binding transcriptional LysR family regulator